LEWAQVRALAADGVSEREIACRLGINRRTVARLRASDQLPRYRRPPTGSQLDSFEPVLRRLLEEWPQIKAPRLTEILRCDYGYAGSLRLVQARLQRLRPSTVRPAQRTSTRFCETKPFSGAGHACASGQTWAILTALQGERMFGRYSFKEHLQRQGSSMELAGLEPATSWVRSN